METIEHLQQTVNQKTGIKGLVTVTNYVLKCDRAREIDRFLANAHDIAPQVYKKLVAELRSLCEVRQVQYQNLVVLSGRSIIARRLVGDTTYGLEISYGALGSDDTAPDASDTTLNTEVARKTYATRSRSNAQVTIDFYYSKGDTNGTYEEFGCFIGGSATVDTGQLFNRVLTGGWTKSSSEAMTVSVQFDINPA